LAQLLVTLDQERELRLEGRSRLALIKRLQEWIVIRLADSLRDCRSALVCAT